MADGVTVSKRPDGRWRVRWRERKDGGGWTQRERVLSDEGTAQELAVKLRRTLALGELPDLAPVRTEPEVATLDAVLGGWVRARVARGVAPATAESYVASVSRILSTLRAEHGIPVDRAIPGALLTRDTVVRLTTALRRARLSDGTVAVTVRTLLAAWAWACDDAVTYPGLAPAPRDPGAVTPRAPAYGSTVAPTIAEVDAVLRHLAALRSGGMALPVAVIARCTGLRMGQILALDSTDFTLSARTLLVRTGKSRREKSDARRVPLAPALVDFITPMVAAGGPLFPKRSHGAADDGPRRGRGGPDDTLRRAWEAATAAGDVRREVWAPPNRRLPRPGHAFRAAFQAHLVAAGVRDETIDTLVGHAGGLRDRHYVDPSARWAAMVDAVATIPPIDWRAEETAPDNVVRLK